MRRRRLGWILYGVCAGAVLVTLAWLAATTLELEEAEALSRRRAAHEERVRLALWHMDSWLLPILARESGRPYFEYLAYHPTGRTYTRILQAIEPGEVLQPSPLLAVKPPFVRLHFQIDGQGTFTSPQIPRGNLRDLAEATCLSPETVPQNLELEARVRALVAVPEVRRRVLEAEAQEAAILGGPGGPTDATSADDPLARSQTEWNVRNKGAFQAKREARADAENVAQVQELRTDAAEVVRVGPLVPLWLGPAGDELFFFRRVQVNGAELLQGLFCDWPGLAAALLEQVHGLEEPARLEPVPAGDARSSPRGLACIPARLCVPPVAAAAGWPLATRRGATLGMSFGLVAVALAAVGLTLRRSFEFGERQRRFASAVTHELRTPLTTFRMYAEMLADGVVQEPPRRRAYLETLKTESARLATLVDNVLAYARLEDRRGAFPRRPLVVGELLERLGPRLEARAQEAGLAWHCSAGTAADARVQADPEAVHQILFNLVDNACKYARDGDSPRVELLAAAVPQAVLLRVCDRGPGIGPADARHIFEPFERGAHERDPSPGIGLGLALARELARACGGELSLERAQSHGASFLLRLPTLS